MEWYQKAASQGDVKAQVNLGNMYHGGRGVPKDDIRAYAWLSLAAAHDNLAKQNATIVENGLTPRQKAEAQEFSAKLAGQIANRQQSFVGQEGVEKAINTQITTASIPDARVTSEGSEAATSDRNWKEDVRARKERADKDVRAQAHAEAEVAKIMNEVFGGPDSDRKIREFNEAYEKARNAR